MPKKKTTTKPKIEVTDMDSTERQYMTAGLDSDRTLHERLLAAWEEASYVHRDADAGNWTAASYDAVVGKLRPYLLKHRILVYPDDHSFRVTPNGNSLLVEAGLRFVNADDPKDFIVVPSCCQGTKNGPGQEQLAGALQTYCYKSALKYAFLLETGDDPDLQARPTVDVKLTPEIEAKVYRVRELVGAIAPEDPESYIRDKLAALSAKYSRPVGFLEGMPEELMDGWIAQLEKAEPKKKTDVPSPPGGNEARNAFEARNTFAPDPEPKVEPKGTPVDLTGGAPNIEPPDEAPTEDVSKIPPRDRGAKIIGWLSNQRGHIGQVTIRHAFSGWMHENEYDRKLTDDKKWQQIWDRREEILADLDERVEAKA